VLLYKTAHLDEFGKLPSHANVSSRPATVGGARCCCYPHNRFLLEFYLEAHVLRNTLIALVAAAALGLPAATTASAAGHAHAGGRGGYAMAGHNRGGHVAGYGGGYRTGPIYDSCSGYGSGYGYRNGGCGVGGAIGGIIGNFVY
jgi:hypothetical protein